MFLSDFGLSEDTILLIRDQAVLQKGRIIFPFFLYSEMVDHEEISITRTIKKANKGLFIVEPVPYSIKTNAYFFNNVLELLYFYENNIKSAFFNSVFIVDPIPPKIEDINFIKSAYPHIENYVIVSSNDLYGTCRAVKLAFFINGKIPSITKNENNLAIDINDIRSTYDINKFSFRKLAKDYDIPISTKVIKPKGYITYSEFYNKHATI